MSYYCETCSKDITNQWAIIGNKHVGCPNASKEDKLREELEAAVSCDCDLDCTPNLDNVMEWLELYYNVEENNE